MRTIKKIKIFKIKMIKRLNSANKYSTDIHYLIALIQIQTPAVILLTMAIADSKYTSRSTRHLVLESSRKTN